MPDRELHVLLVDDDEEELVITRDLLAQAPNGFRVDWTPSPEQALAEIAARRHDAYLVDYNLGALNGIELIAQAHEEGSAGPFVLLTGQSEPEIDLRALRAGATDYLSKQHLTPELLARTIRYAVERHELQTQMRETMRLDLVGVLAGGIAHEYNNLLTAVLGHLSIARGHDDPLVARRHLDDARAAAQRAAELTGRLVAYARQFPIRVRPDLEAAVVVGRAIERAWALAGATFDVDRELPADLPPVAGDEDLLVELLAALVVNAHEAAPQRAPRVAAACVDLDAEDLRRFDGGPAGAGRFLAVAVSDHGPGMDRATVQRIFDPFFSTKFLGRGLGLAAASGIAQAHGAPLRVESQPGSGTTVTVALPLHV